MSEPAPDAGHPEEPRSLADRALDLLVFAPAEAVLSALDDIPGTAARGRARIEQEVRNAQLIGRFAVGEGQRRIKRGIDLLSTGGGAPRPVPPSAGEPPIQAPSEPPVRPVPAAAPAEPTRTQSAPAPSASAVPADETAAGATTGAEDLADAAAAADLAIPGFDSLSASQVVRRLDGLGPHELASVFRHESATRGRRTILHRAQQLLGQSGQRPSDGS